MGQDHVKLNMLNDYDFSALTYLFCYTKRKCFIIIYQDSKSETQADNVIII